jgi:fructoselysine and glucoselysine-specific PTS system IIB component
MIKLCRVDHRLLHGQVAFSWTNAVQADCILVASDEVVNDEMWKTTLKLGKPAGVKLVIKDIENSVKALNSGVTDKYKLFIVVESVEDADRLARALDIKEINLGGTKPTDDRHVISTAVYVSDNDEKILKDLMNDGFDVFTQMVPSDKRVNTKDLLK